MKKRRVTSYTRVISILVLAALVAYGVPWVTNPSMSLSYGASDLAEWTSLHPGVQSGNPPFLTSMLLRLPLTCLVLIIALQLPGKKLWVRLFFVLFSGIALLPPLEFFTLYPHDPNYRQQFYLTVVTIVGGIIAIGISDRGFAKPLALLVTIVGAVCSLAGLMQAHSLMTAFKLATQISAGGIGLIIIFMILGLNLSDGLWPVKQTR